MAVLGSRRPCSRHWHSAARSPGPRPPLSEHAVLCADPRPPGSSGSRPNLRACGRVPVLRSGSRVPSPDFSLLLLTGSGYGWVAYRTLQTAVTHVDGLPGTRRSSSDAAQNILLVGDDHRPDGASPQLLEQLSTQLDGGSTNTDTMMVLHLPAGDQQAIGHCAAPRLVGRHPRPRHRQAQFRFRSWRRPRRRRRRGMRLLITTVEGVTGLHIDIDFARISLLGFYRIAEVLGPVQVCLNHAAADPALRGGPTRGGLHAGRQAGAVLRPPTARSAPGRPRPAGTPAVLPGGRAAQPPVVGGAGEPGGRLHELVAAVGAAAAATDPGLDLLDLAARASQLGRGAVALLDGSGAGDADDPGQQR